MKESVFTASDGKELVLYSWDIPNPQAMIQIIHGMNEHMGRYDEIAAYFNSQGFSVSGIDMRGHGKTDDGRIGITTEGEEMFFDSADDQLRLSTFLADTKGVPIIVFGHSYGSFIAQYYMLHLPFDDRVKGFILTGAAFQGGALLTFGKLAARLGRRDAPAKLIAKLTFDSYDKKTKEGRSAWITRDKTIVEKYNNDPYIIPVFSKGFYRSFFKGISKIFRRPNYLRVKSLPVLIACGSEDGVGGYSKLSKKLYAKMSPFIDKLELKLYEGFRHEIHNEIDRVKVFEDLKDFINKIIKV